MKRKMPQCGEGVFAYDEHAYAVVQESTRTILPTVNSPDRSPLGRGGNGYPLYKILTGFATVTGRFIQPVAI